MALGSIDEHREQAMVSDQARRLPDRFAINYDATPHPFAANNFIFGRFSAMEWMEWIGDFETWSRAGRVTPNSTITTIPSP